MSAEGKKFFREKLGGGIPYKVEVVVESDGSVMARQPTPAVARGGSGNGNGTAVRQGHIPMAGGRH